MGFFYFKNLLPLQELTADGRDLSQDDDNQQQTDYTQDDDNPPANQNQQEPAAGGGTDNPPAGDAGATGGGDAGTTDYTQDDTAGGAEGDAGGGAEGGEGGEAGTTDYTQDDGGGDEGGAEGGDNPEGGEEGDQPAEGEEGQEEQQPQGLSNQLKDIEAQLFSNLTPEQISIKDTELKMQYIDLYKSTDKLITRVDNLSKSDENIQILDFVSKKLNEVRTILNDYIINTYKTNSYTENQLNLKHFLLIIEDINKILEGIKGKSEKDEKSKEK